MRNKALHRPLLKAAWLWLIFFYGHLISFTQTTNISGLVNTYHAVVQIIPEKACVRVSSTLGLSASSKVMLIQMKGATINVSNSAAFGDTISLNNAGNYEIGTICTIRGDSVFLLNNILNNYTVPSGKVQLVQFGQYVSANVTGPITAQTWDNVAGTGGVIAIFAEQDLTLNADITADGRGYRGGTFIQDNGSCNNFTPISAYAYDAFIGSLTVPQAGAFKGEGATEIIASQSGGRGASANGGGGGNNHNNSGGGGANLSAGGIGGGPSGSVGCRQVFRGEAGKRLSSWNGRKIFTGGGGGAGHNNNGLLGTPANGGGIIFIHATNIISNGNKISAAGSYGGESFSDGAGGGGAGGTIIMDVNTYTDAVTIKAEGGQGGESHDGDNPGRCFGGGGGGSGGVIYFTGSSPGGATVNGGSAGIESLRHSSCNAPQAAGSGTAGQIITSYVYRASPVLAGYCSTVLPVRLNFFKAISSQNLVTLSWQLPSMEEISHFIIEKLNASSKWVEFRSVPGYELQQNYTAEDKSPQYGYNTYRLKVIEKTNSFIYSPIRRVFAGDKKEPLAFYPNPAIDKISIKGNFTGSTDIRLLDISGKLVLHKKTGTGNNTELTLPALTPGVYILHINETVNKLVIR